MDRKRIVILGGGYSGMMAARRLAHKTRGSQAEITLVNGLDHFVQRIRLHQVAADQPLRPILYSELLANTGVRFVQGWVNQLTLDAHALAVQTSEGPQTIAYDYLIYALGSHIDTSGVPGAQENALSVSTEATTLALRDRLRGTAENGRRLVICGGGLTGIEIAAELAESYKNSTVSLITRGAFGAQLSETGRAYLRRAFDRLGITVIDNVDIKHISPEYVQHSGGRLDFDLCLWAGAFGVPALARESGLAVNSAGQIISDDHLRSVSHPEIYAVGDAADVSGAINTPIRMACATALPMGAYAADDLAARVQGQPHRAYEFSYGGRCISLGRKDGLMQLVDADDNPKERIVTGWLAARIKETICRYVVWQINNPGLMYYPHRPAAERHATRDKLAATAR